MLSAVKNEHKLRITFQFPCLAKEYRFGGCRTVAVSCAAQPCAA